MRHRLDIVTVRIKNKSAIIVLVIMRPETGGAIIAAACRQRCFIKRFDFLPVCCRECDVEAARQRRSGANPELRALPAKSRVAVGAIFRKAELLQNDNPQRRQRLLVESDGPGVVGHRETDVIKDIQHDVSFCA